MAGMKRFGGHFATLASALLLSVGVATTAPTSAAAAQPTAEQQALASLTWGDRVWKAARSGDSDAFFALIEQTPEALAPSVRETIATFREAIEKREQLREEQRGEAREKLGELLEASEQDSNTLSEALVHAVHLLELTDDPRAVYDDPQIKLLRVRAERAARQAEKDGQWLVANELFYRLNTLYEDFPSGAGEAEPYAEDLARQNRRLSMIQFYAPQALWRMRNEREIADGRDPLPDYAPIDDDFRERLHGIAPFIVAQALKLAAQGHVEEVDVRQMVLRGIDALVMMAQTPELYDELPELAVETGRAAMLAGLQHEREQIDAAARLTPTRIERLVNQVVSLNDQALGLPREVILHEFANGAMSQLDEFSAIIWPDELRRFERHTSGNYTGVGIQIQLDPQRNIQVVTPLEDTPAYRADIRPGDLIRTVNGQPTTGWSLNQTAERITGPGGEEVVLGIERPLTGGEGEDLTLALEVPIVRETIVVKTVKGWERTEGSDWDWFIDDDNGIGYVRLTQFTGSTSTELRMAIEQMRKRGLRGLILDLRFNPGGLLDQAIEVSNIFIPEGDIVGQVDGMGRRAAPRRANPRFAVAADLPVAVLINQSSASASEIVSGALQDHTRRGIVDAVVFGRRSYGKGSVQNVWGLQDGRSAMKLTKHYYTLPSGRVIHRKPGAADWGVTPDFEVSMLPSQTLDAVLHRRDADMLPAINGEAPEDAPRPEDLLDEGMDPQLHTALLALQARVMSRDLSARSIRE